MKIILFGYGKMGKRIEEIAMQKGHEIVHRFNSNNAKMLTPADLPDADVAIEFSRPDSAFHNVMLCLEANLPVVCGTTGWNDKLIFAEKYCTEHRRSFFYASNFSLGVNLFFEINTLLARLMHVHPSYEEVIIHESHHSGKLDAPSGTAITLASQILSHAKRFKQWVSYSSGESIRPGRNIKEEIPVFSTREGDVPGTHIVKYFSETDEIEIIHKALNRDGFALGAIAAAEWLIGKKGVYGMKDLLKL